MILRSVAILVIWGFLCSTTVCQEQKVEALPAAPPAKLVFYRTTGFLGTGVNVSIKIDSEKPIHKIPNNRTWATELPAGPHFFCSDDKQYGRTYTLEGGKTYYFRVDMLAPSMTGRGHFRVSNVPADLADADMTGLEAEYAQP
jgi:hypothetical protein